MCNTASFVVSKRPDMWSNDYCTLLEAFISESEYFLFHEIDRLYYSFWSIHVQNISSVKRIEFMCRCSHLGRGCNVRPVEESLTIAISIRSMKRINISIIAPPALETSLFLTYNEMKKVIVSTMTRVPQNIKFTDLSILFQLRIICHKNRIGAKKKCNILVKFEM